MIGIWMILRIQETVQNENFRNFIFNDVSLLKDFLMQYNLCGFLCPVYAWLKALEPKFMVCSHFILFYIVGKIATCIYLFFSLNVDQLYVFYAKLLSTGTAVRFEGWKNTFLVYYSLCFIYDVNISGLLKMRWHTMLYSFNVTFMKVLLESNGNKCANNISYNSQMYAYGIIFDSLYMDHIILRSSAEFVQKFQALVISDF